MELKTMRRSLKFLLRPDNFFYYPVLFLKIVFAVKNWPRFLFAYSGLNNEPFKIYFRNGIIINAGSAIDAATACVVMIKKDYGNTKGIKTIIDIGANIGAFSVFSAIESKTGCVLAFEPEPNNFELLKKNIADNRLRRIKPFKIAVSDETGRQNLYISEYSAYHSLNRIDGSKKITVQTISLNQILKTNKVTHCDLLKIDCEGGEFKILYSANKSTLKKISEIRMEYHNRKRNENIQELSKFLEEHGFSISRFKANSSNSGDIWFKKI